MKSGELFAGVGGLGMAVNEVFGAEPAWFAEFDAAPSKVLAHHYPDVPNYGDVTKLLDPPKVDVLAGGFPCQDVSLAGRRRGMKEGTRSGLWSEFARLIDTVRPDWVVIENVRGLLSADAAGVVEPCPLCVGDDPEHVLRALGAVLGDLAELGFDAEWTGLRASDIGAPHGRFRVFILAWSAERTVADAAGGRRDRRPRVQIGSTLERAIAAGGGSEPRSEMTLLPTPAAGLHNDGESVESWSARRDRVKATGINGNGMGMPLPIAVQLLPTPTVTNQHGNEYNGRGELLLPGIVQLLPTPRTTDMNGPGVHGDGGVDLRTAVTMMPTPRASRGGSATETMYALGAERVDDERTQGQVVGDITEWGPYAPAIRRWEVVTGRPAPAPVRHDGKGGRPRLNPELTEWMMGWPAGWVTAPEIGLTRAEQLKGCGNGVVPQQAAAAQREILARPGVPALSPTCRSDQEPGTRLLA